MYASIEELATGLESGQFTSVDLVTVISFLEHFSRVETKASQAYSARILEVNGTLNVVTEINPDAVAIAAQLDAERANGTIRGHVTSSRLSEECLMSQPSSWIANSYKGWGLVL